MKKLLLALLLVAAMVITFAACDDNPAGGTTDGNGTTDAPEETEAPLVEVELAKGETEDIVKEQYKGNTTLVNIAIPECVKKRRAAL